MEAFKRRFEFAAILALFTPVVIEALFTQDLLGGQSTILQWAAISITLLVGNYCLIEFLGNIPPRLLLVVNVLLFINLLAYIPFFVVLAAYPISMPLFFGLIFQGSAGLVIGTSFAIFSVLFILAIFNFIKTKKTTGDS